MTGQLGTPLPVGSHPCALTFDGERLWVANEWELSVQPIDPVTRQVGMPIEAGAHPCALFFDNTRLWIANEDDNTVQYIVVRSPN